MNTEGNGSVVEAEEALHDLLIVATISTLFSCQHTPDNRNVRTILIDLCWPFQFQAINERGFVIFLKLLHRIDRPVTRMEAGYLSIEVLEMWKPIFALETL